MKSLLILAGFIALTQAVFLFDLSAEEWNLYKLIHRKNYATEQEEHYRKKIYLENKKRVMKHNNKYEQGLVSFKMKLNHLSDMFSHEVAQHFNGFNKSIRATNRPRPVGSSFIVPENVQIPSSADWRKRGAVTGVKDQGQCGSCWAFSTTGSLEGQNFRKTGTLVSLSEQNLIDCSTDYGNNGCNGGLMDQAFQYIEDNKGIDTEKSYPYEAEDDKCRYKARSKGATDTGFTDIPSGDEEALKVAVATVGPISIAIDASRETFQMYSEGVYYDPKCSSEQLDHGVLVVGYGTSDEGQDYWIVKNSWNEKWGDKGYILMARNRHNHCGIATAASYPLV